MTEPFAQLGCSTLLPKLGLYPLPTHEETSDFTTRSMHCTTVHAIAIIHKCEIAGQGAAV